MPMGTLTVILRRFLTSPEPWQLLHGESISLPFPLHVGQTLTCTYVAKPALRIFWILPAPPHLGQILADVPGFAPDPPQTSHLSVLGISISFSVPLAASSRVISRL